MFSWQIYPSPAKFRQLLLAALVTFCMSVCTLQLQCILNCGHILVYYTIYTKLCTVQLYCILNCEHALMHYTVYTQQYTVQPQCIKSVYVNILKYCKVYTQQYALYTQLCKCINLLSSVHTAVYCVVSVYTQLCACTTLLYRVQKQFTVQLQCILNCLHVLT